MDLNLVLSSGGLGLLILSPNANDNRPALLHDSQNLFPLLVSSSTTRVAVLAVPD